MQDRNTEEILVSIIVPVKNTAQYVSRCLESLIHQTYTNTEILTVYDESSDNSMQILQEYAAKDGRIQIVEGTNSGLMSARNTAVAVSKGSYIWHVDSDDYAELDSLEKMVGVVKRDGCDIVITGYKTVQDPAHPENYIYRGPKFDRIITGAEALVKMLCTKLGGDPWARMYRRTLYKDSFLFQKEKITFGDDIPLNYQMLSNAETVSPLDAATIVHIHREGSLSSKSTMQSIELTAHEHLTYVHCGSYGFVNEDVKNAWKCYVGRNFIGCFKRGSKRLMRKIDADTVRTIYGKLTYLTSYQYIRSGEQPNFTLKKRLVYGALRNRLLRFTAAVVMRLAVFGFKK